MASGWLLDDWREKFRTEARLRGVAGAEIGAALAEVETYCGDSGMDPAQTYGEPAEYAAVLASGGGPAVRSPGADRRPWLAALVAGGSLTGVMSLLTGVDAVTRGVRGAITVGQVVSAAVGVAGIVAVAAFLLRPDRSRWRGVDWRFGLAAAGAIGVTTVPQLIWKRAVLDASGWVLVGAGLLLVVLAWWPLLSGRLLADRVPGPGAGPARPGWLLGAVRWGLPAMLLCAVLLAVLLGAFG